MFLIDTNHIIPMERYHAGATVKVGADRKIAAIALANKLTLPTHLAQ